ncbi:metal ABC transporter solute-binding protein, Zn/Mn family [Lacticaseibacillus sp. GG6-2]
MRKKVALVVIGLLLVLSGCAAKPAAKHSVRVVTSVDFYAEVAKAVVGNHGHVTSIINDPAVDPHDFDPTVATGKQVADADVVLANGAGYDSWMTKLTAAEPDVQVVSAAKVVGVKNGENEHIWYKPDAMPLIANALAAKLAKRDPTHAKAYRANARRYIAGLKPLMQQIDTLRQNSHHRLVAVSEPVFNNALTYMGYRVANMHFASAVEEGTDPSPADVRTLNAQMQRGEIAFFVVNTQVSSKIVDNVVAQAKKDGVPILNVTETLPRGLTYTSWMLKQYRALAKIQQ